MSRPTPHDPKVGGSSFVKRIARITFVSSFVALFVALVPSAEAILVKADKSRTVRFDGSACGSFDSASLGLPSDARRINLGKPFIGATFRDWYTRAPVARVTSRGVTGSGGGRSATWRVVGDYDICENPAEYEGFGWETSGVRLQVAYATPEKVFIQFSSRDQYKPRTFYFGASSRITNMHWRGWDNRRAKGSGVFPFNDCIPYCAVGNVKNYRVKVRASRVRKCDGRYRYMRLNYRYVDAKPNGADRSATMRASCQWII